MNEKSVTEWIKKAESDLKTGKDEFMTFEPATDTICFHMQQCVEKYLKDFLIFNGKEIKRTHIIEELVKDCEDIDSEFHQLFEVGIQNLTDFAVELRYPGEFMFPSVEETKEAIKIAEKAKAFVMEKLRKKGFKNA